MPEDHESPGGAEHQLSQQLQKSTVPLAKPWAALRHPSAPEGRGFTGTVQQWAETFGPA